jgi:hypothetical protein
MIVHQIKWDHGYSLGGKLTSIYLASPRVRHLCCSDKEAFKPHKMAVMSINPDPIKEQGGFVKKQNLNVGTHSGGNIHESVMLHQF